VCSSDLRLSAVRVDDAPGAVARHGIDGQVAAPQVLFERDRGREIGDETTVTWPHLALEPGERVFLVGLGMQEHREIPAHGTITQVLELGGCGAHDHPVALLDRSAQQLVPDRAAYEVDLHAHMLTEVRARTTRQLAGACLLMSTWSLSSCGIGYLVQAAQGQSQVMQARQPIDRVIASGSTDAALKARLELVRAARDFASGELRLPDNDSYRSYAALGRPYVVWNVVAAPEFSVLPKTWWFPITGRVAYRGYFKEDNARKFALGLQAQGYDTLVGGVSAYSTLGRFADPVLDTMMSYGDLQLVGTIFHELAHQLVYVKSDSEFNEAFAVSVERAGLARWLAARGQGRQLDDYRARQDQQAQIVNRFAAGRAQLAAFYGASESMPPAERRQRKQELLASVTAEVRGLEQQLGVKTGYDAWLDAGLNNAHLASIATYYDCVPGFERLLAAQHDDLPAYYAAVRKLALGPAAGRAALCARQPAS